MKKVDCFNFFFFVLIYGEMSTYYQRNRERLLERAKEYYEETTKKD